MIKKIINLNNGLLRLIVEFIILGIFAWTFIQVRDLPGTYVTKAEANQVKIEMKTDIDRAIDPMRKQIQQIYNYLLGEKQVMLMEIKNYLQLNEGLRLKPYRCSAGRLTIGYGRNLEDVGISLKEAEFMLLNDIDRCIEEAVSIFGDRFYRANHNAQTVIIDMLFNLGKSRFKKFKRTIQAIKDMRWNKAADELLDSRYAKQLPGRANRNAELMREKQ